jgi:hypothetical protein
MANPRKSTKIGVGGGIGEASLVSLLVLRPSNGSPGGLSLLFKHFICALNGVTLKICPVEGWWT